MNGLDLFFSLFLFWLLIPFVFYSGSVYGFSFPFFLFYFSRCTGREFFYWFRLYLGKTMLVLHVFIEIGRFCE